MKGKENIKERDREREIEKMQQCIAEETCRVGNLKKQRTNKEKEEERKGLDPDNGGQI